MAFSTLLITVTMFVGLGQSEKILTNTECIPSAKVGHIGPRVKRELEGLRG